MEVPVKSEIVSTEKLAAYLGLKPQTLRTWRQEGKGPAWFRVSDRGPVRYRMSDIEDWMSKRVAASRAGDSTSRRGDYSKVTSPCDE